MHLIALVTNHEGFANYGNALRLIRARGGKSEIICLAPVSRQWHGNREDPGLPVRILANSPGLAAASAETCAVRELARAVVDEDPDIFFHCDPQTPVAIQMTGLLRELGYRGLIIGGQGCLAPPDTAELHADRWLCFGARQVARMGSKHRTSVYAAGLPHLDRLRNLPVTLGGYGVFLAHRSPEAPVIDATLAAYEKHFRLPLVVRDHPDYPERYRHRPTLPLPPILTQSGHWSTTTFLQHCNLVLGTDATSLIDALYLGKPVALLPNAGLTAFDHFPGISDGFSPAAISAAALRVVRQPQRVLEFLDDVVGGVRHDHAECVVKALERLVSSGPLRAVSGLPAPVLASANGEYALPSVATRVELAGLISPGGNAAELGVAKGSFSDELLRARSDIHLYSIDRWAGDRGHDDGEFSAARALLARHGGRSTVVRKSFAEAVQDFGPGSLDFIYLDGYAHDGQDGGRTLESWWSRVKPGGIFAGHDYHPDWKSTMDVVDDFCRRHGLEMQTTSGDFFPSWYVRKAVAA